jgi:hypothetical protein
MDIEPISTDQMRLIALEEGLRSAIALDKLRLQMLNESVDWICDLTGLELMEVRQQIAYQKGGQVARNLATINAVRSVVANDSPAK